MLYVAMTFWLMLIVLSAWGVQRLWSQFTKPRVINVVLLPGTLVAQLGHVLGLLVTGATVTNNSLYQDESGEPATTQNPTPKIPVVGPMIVGLLPLLACAAAIVLVARYLGSQLPSAIWRTRLPDTLPTTLAGAWQLARDQVSLMENVSNAALDALPGTWRLWLFLYLVICLTVRMAPFPGNMRGSLSAILLLGIAAAAIGIVSPSSQRFINAAWVGISLTVPTLMLLLALSALIRGLIGLSRLIAHNE